MPRRSFARREVVGLAAVAACSLGTSVPGSAMSSDGCAGVVGETIRWLVPYSAGGGFDTYSGLLQPFYEARLGAQIVVTNMPGRAA